MISLTGSLKRKLNRIKWKVRRIVRKKWKDEYKAGEILDLVFQKIKRGYAEEEIVFPNAVFSLIADDSDWHRTRRGFMRYNSAVIFQRWLLGKGQAWGSYPADPYDKDIIAIRIKKDLLKDKTENQKAEAVMEEISKSRHNWFSSSIIAARKSGHFFVGKRWQEVMAPMVTARVSDFVREKLKTHTDVLIATMQGMVPAVKSSIKYKRKLADFLSETVIDILRNE